MINLFSHLNLKLLSRLFVATSLLGIILIIFDLGFSADKFHDGWVNYIYYLIILSGIIDITFRAWTLRNVLTLKAKIIDIFSVILFGSVLILAILIKITDDNIIKDSLYSHNLVIFSVFYVFVRKIITFKFRQVHSFLNPSQLFVFSFILVIVVGSLLLMMPNSTYHGIKYIDSLFVSGSAVCVTGLSSVDVEYTFTGLGLTIIMVLIQIGGLGILTFASYFSYIFMGGSTLQSRLTYGELNNSKMLGDVFKTFKQVILITLIVEFIGFVGIYLTVFGGRFNDFGDRSFFAVFHSVSAFCNAGFSTISAGLYDSSVKFNYGLQLIIIMLFVIGGLGFPIISNLFYYVRNKLYSLYLKYHGFRPIYYAWNLNLNSRITLITTVSLSMVATIFVFANEYGNVLSEHGFFGKMIVAMFTATTPRTAGFNSVDFSLLNPSTILIIIVLMWIGASPASTGGGIKTSTFALAILNVFSLAKQKTRIEIYRRKISNSSVRRANAMIFTSLIVIGSAIFLLTYFDADKSLRDLTFETFSAFGTVGLSLGITGKLSAAGKFVLVVVMFIGRVGLLSIMVGFFRKSNITLYTYPKEEILIN